MNSTPFLLLFLISTTAAQINLNLCERFNKQSEHVISPKCFQQLNTTCHNGDLLWKMFDASSKYPFTGMSYTNNRDLGNYDECVSIDYKDADQTILGKFCTFSLVFLNPLLKKIDSPFDYGPPGDHPAAEGPAANIFMSLLSTCTPDACTPEEVGRYFVFGDLNLANNNVTDLTKLIIYNHDAFCATKDSNTEFAWGSILFLVFIGAILLLLICSTGYDYMITMQGKKTLHPLFLAFSVLTNGRKLLHVNRQRNPEQFSSLNGMRFISMLWVIAGHNIVAWENLPLVNYAEIHKWIGSVKVQYLGSAPIAVDTFFFLSGFLLAFGYLKMAKKVSLQQQIAGIPMMYIHRYLRLTPALAVLYCVMVTVYKMLGSGPLWETVSHLMVRQCQDHWWSFFLYIQNYANYDDMCLTHSWFLSADMQMFILAPIVLIPIARLVKQDKTKTALWTILILIVVSVIIPIGIRFADETYTNTYDTHSRFNDYLIGILLGVIMREYLDKPFYFTKIQNFVIWVVVLVSCLAFNLYYHDVVMQYEHTKDTLFYGLYRPLWCFSLAWMVYSCYHGYGGPIDWILSRPIFQVLGRLSYCMYLVHAVVQVYWVGAIRTPYYWSDFDIFYVWSGHFTVTMIISLIWTLAFESPVIVIERYIFGGVGKKPAAPKKPEETKNGNESYTVNNNQA